MAKNLTPKTTILDAKQMARIIRRMAGEIVERHHGDLSSLLLVGIRTRGVPLAEKIAAEIERMEGAKVPVGILDITLYRDDLSTVGAAAAGQGDPPAAARSTTARSSSATTSSTPAAPCARRSTSWSTSAGRGRAARRADRPRPPRAADPGRLRGQEGPDRRRARSSRSPSWPPTTTEQVRILERPGAVWTPMTMPPETPIRWRRKDLLGIAELSAGGDRADPRHRRVVRRDRRAADQEGPDAARQDGAQPLLRGLDAHPLELRDRREAAVGRQHQLLDLRLGPGEGRDADRHGAQPAGHGAGPGRHPPRPPGRAAHAGEAASRRG